MTDVERMDEASGLQKLEGVIEHIVYTNEENGYTICDMAASDDEIVTIVGIMPLLSVGDHMCVYGKWTHNAKYGRQFSVSQYERMLPADTASILRYLSSRAIKGIGPKTAQRIVEEFGEDSFDVIENHPEWLATIKGISLKMATAASESFREQAGIRSAMMFFRDYFGVSTTVKIYKKWGSSAVDVAKRNPYRLCNEIEGIGFERADAMASSLGIGHDNFDRVMSGLRYVLMQNASNNGHVCLPRQNLKETSAQLLGISPEQADEGISEMLRVGRFRYVLREDVQWIYDENSYEDEKYIAEKLILLDRMCASLDVSDIDRFIDNEESRSGIHYAALQKRAISDALRYGVMVLTGGPGTGKTTVVRALIHIFHAMGFSIALAAPTGRAAKRLSEATSREAKTIHRLLEMSYDPSGRAGFARNEHNLLDEQVVIVDESSMIDQTLMCALLRAIKPGARLIIIGDADQLPSVGAGNILGDVIASERFATVRLSEIFRQAQESLIVTNAHKINAGQMPRLDVKDKDFFFLRRASDREVAVTVADLCKNRLPRTYGDLARNGIQVISPSRKGEAGTENLNVILQDMLNPRDAYKREHRHRERTFREGDRVMQTRNNYDLTWTRDVDDKMGNGIFNGDIGVIEQIDPNASMMTVLFDERRVEYEFSLLEDLDLAYAITVHKSQGSEYPIVIVPMASAAQMLQTRNLLYTAVTRGQTMVILVGREDIVERMVANDRQSTRYTGLWNWLQAEQNEE